MPVIDTPLNVTYFSGTYVKSYTDAYKSWVRTTNYGTIPKSDLPVNPYWVGAWRGDVNHLYQSSHTNISSGVTTTDPAIGWGIDTLHDHDVSLDAYCNANLQSESSILNEMIIDCLNKAADSKINLAVSIAEAGKTADLILSSAHRLYRAYRALRRGNFQEVARLLNISPKRVHKTWLEYKYGWMPTLMDVKGAAEAFAQHNLGRAPRFKVSTTRTRSFSGTRVTVTPYTPRHTTQVTTDVVSNMTYKHRLFLEFEVSNPRLAQLSSLGLTNPLALAQELTPFSFVFDWFISVGNWLSAMSAMHGLSLRKAGFSTKREWTFSRTYRDNGGYDTSYTYTPADITYTATGNQFYRTIPVVDPLSISPPVNSAPFSWEKTLTSLALLRSNASKMAISARL